MGDGDCGGGNTCIASANAGGCSNDATVACKADADCGVGNTCIGEMSPLPTNHESSPGIFNSTSVQLAPFALTPNPGGVYKVWLMPTKIGRAHV